MASKSKPELPASLLDRFEAGLGSLRESLGPKSLAHWRTAFKDVKGRVVTTGVGKSRPAAEFFAESLATLGEDARFVHPVEALHGALGRFGSNDLLVVFSATGQTREPLRLMRWARQQKAMVGLISAEEKSPMAREAKLTLVAGGGMEEPIPLLPLVRSQMLFTAAQVLVGLWYETRPLKVPDLARYQPDTALARLEALKVGDALKVRGKNPIVHEEDTVVDSLAVLTREGLGAVAVVNDDGQCVGILTDGDIRRLMQKSQGSMAKLFLTPVNRVMTQRPTTIRKDAPAREAIDVFEARKITVLPVVDAKGKMAGMVHLHDLVEIGFTL